ncbi:MAG: DNA mismatch repair endonuclease MutL [Candidatus Theseobacter exili]|nr:DNA mismatch repair endonuclease MutL [Candidatus Theseobacter exili]
MQRIHILPDGVINKIAAGEVVERPASVVKELLENAIDAGATRIIVEIKKGGKDLIRITDNGSGMMKEDCLLAIQRHATSKIEEVEDLVNIQTLGFRGEALASIASVSRFSLRTRCKDEESEAGTYIQMEGDKILEVREEGCPCGAIMEVRSLFFNVPARRKFLKTDRTEMASIMEVVSQVSLANLKTGFQLISDGKESRHFLPGETLTDRIRGLYGASFSSRGITMEVKKEDFELTGWLGKPETARTDRKGQHWFVNGRSVRSPFLSYALSEGYGTTIMQNRYPSAVVFFKLPGEEVDVNVHPAKKEIRFADTSSIRGFLIHSVRETLQKNDLVPHVTFPDETGFYREEKSSGLSRSELVRDATEQYLKLNEENALPDHSGTAVAEESFQEQLDESRPLSFDRIIGVLADMYILVESQKGLIIIDQHAAHERVLYEQTVHEINNRGVETQALLMPPTIEMSYSEASLLEENIALIQEAGIILEDFGQNTFLVRAVPSSFQGSDIQRLVFEIVDALRHGRDLKESDTERQERIIRKICRSSVMARDRLKEEELLALLDSLVKCRQPHTCPHGRPTMIKLSGSELDKRFKRV